MVIVYSDLIGLLCLVGIESVVKVVRTKGKHVLVRIIRFTLIVLIITVVLVVVPVVMMAYTIVGGREIGEEVFVLMCSTLVFS